MSETITPQLSLFIFVVILLIAALVAMSYSDFGMFKNSRGHTFIIMLIGLGIFITFLFYYSIVELQNSQSQLATIQETSKLSADISDGLMNDIRAGSTKIPNFALSLTPLIICNSNIPVDPETPETCIAKMTLSYKIFNVWQQIVLAHNFVNYDPLSYTTNFLQRANSKQLLEQWKLNKINFNDDTQSFGDLLFEYALPITVQTPELYVETANKLLKDPRYIKLIS